MPTVAVIQLSSRFDCKLPRLVTIWTGETRDRRLQSRGGTNVSGKYVTLVVQPSTNRCDTADKSGSSSSNKLSTMQQQRRKRRSPSRTPSPGLPPRSTSPRSWSLMRCACVLQLLATVPDAPGCPPVWPFARLPFPGVYLSFPVHVSTPRPCCSIPHRLLYEKV